MFELLLWCLVSLDNDWLMMNMFFLLICICLTFSVSNFPTNILNNNNNNNGWMTNFKVIFFRKINSTTPVNNPHLSESNPQLLNWYAKLTYCNVRIPLV